jgi:hypothetical protein
MPVLVLLTNRPRLVKCHFLVEPDTVLLLHGRRALPFLLVTTRPVRPIQSNLKLELRHRLILNTEL